MIRAMPWIVVAIIGSAGCGPDTSSTTRKPAGTISDPVTTCERFADVCKLDGARLGVCASRGSGFACASQH